jgi:hypothetical protein
MDRDIVERLREIAGPIVPNVCTDAAEAIERLRELLENSYEFTKTLTAERDEARRELEEWRNSSAHVEADHPDEVHCGCVPVLRKLLTDARRERDEARRMYCKCHAQAEAIGYAEGRGWDCYKEDGK